MKTKFLALALLALLTTGVAGAAQCTIQPDQLDAKTVYSPEVYGEFNKPAEIDIRRVLRATYEFREIKRSRIGQGTAEYWILMSKANDRALNTILAIAEAEEYDLIVRKGILGNLSPAVQSDDFTDLVVEKVKNQEPRGLSIMGGFAESISVDPDTPLVAIGDGKVTAVLEDATLGKVIKINHGEDLELRYTYVGECLVKQDQEIKEGETIGRSRNEAESNERETEIEVVNLKEEPGQTE